MYYEIKGARIRILGGMHAFPTGREALPSWVENAYAWAHQMAIEHDHADLRAHSFEADGTTLKPWAELLGGLSGQIDAVPGVEQQLILRHLRDARPQMQRLEYAEHFTAGFDEIPLVDIHAALAQMGFKDDDTQTGFEEMHSAWARGDVAALYRTASEGPLMKTRSIHSAMFLERNRSWAKVICSDRNRTENLLVLVGCMHLCGPGNLIAAIQARGRKVVPLI